MQKLTSQEIREKWLDFFTKKKHLIVPPVNLIPKDDPSLLWINSGVATLKPYFDGRETPPSKRLVNIQKAIRTNDIENVGHTARHHTFFEMLGNFSIGDYFKEEAIIWAWELLTSPEGFDIDKDLIYVTVYPQDTETKKIWHEKVGLSDDRIIDIKKNFWDIGEGPSGPNSEIFVDRGKEFQDLPDDDPEMYPGGENERYLEIWNIVFSQFNHLSGLSDPSQYPELPSKNIDTGAGLERLASFFQNTKTNFETDLFIPIIRAIEKETEIKYGENVEKDVSFKIIADHIRTSTFAISDGATPSNDGRGYVIRRLLRRSVLHGKKLGINEPFLEDLVPIVAQTMVDFYPEVSQNTELIQKIISNEEKKFSSTLSAGQLLFENIIEEAKKKDNIVSGKDAFKLYDTFGFPIELTVEQAQEQKIEVDQDGFESEMKQQKERARKARGKVDSMNTQSKAFNDLDVDSKYVGWNDLEVKKAKIVAVIEEDELKEKNSGENVLLVFDQTPFYAEMGGQISDTGLIIGLDDQVIGEVVDVKKSPNGQYVHQANLNQDVEVGQQVNLLVDKKRHNDISVNHTATHLLDQALRNIVGGNIQQAGSFVGENELRFDFNHDGPIDEKQLKLIEDEVNQVIDEDLPISWVETDIKSAEKMGAVAVFGEKYGDVVRVVSIGDYNKEFDGGTHARTTGQLMTFKILSESGIGSGIRRIQAIAGRSAIRYLNQQDGLVKEIVTTVRAQTSNDILDKIHSLFETIKSTEEIVDKLENTLVQRFTENISSNVKTIQGISFAGLNVGNLSNESVRKIVDFWRGNKISDIVVIGFITNSKANLMVGSAIQDKIKAGDIVKSIAEKIDGKGGGKPDLAQAGGNNLFGIDAAIESAQESINKER